VSDSLPHDVLALIDERVHGFEALEVLIRMNADEREWRLDEISEKLGLDRDLARMAIDELIRSELVTRDGNGNYRYAPCSEPLRDAVRHLAESYSTARLDVMRVMAEKAVERLRSSAGRAFADAFTFGKGGGGRG
jgi:DNA-binding IclR family transcriptional regulator